jgi:regulator of protease activity HflC (stomatin/prohibitin superfamily)
MRLLVLLLGLTFFVTACTTVAPGHKGVKIYWGGKTEMDYVLPEGMDVGFSWLWNSCVEYDVREKTLVEKFTFNDSRNMETSVEIALDYNLNPEQVNLIHTRITDIDTKIIKTLKSSGKEVVPQYTASELNLKKRKEAELALRDIIQAELPEFYVEFARVQITDVDIPQGLAKIAEETAIQEGRNALAAKKELEQTNLAKARIAEAKGKYDAALFDAKTKDVLSSPKMLELKKLEIEMEWAKKGISKYGSNNVFGANTAVIKGIE